ncbi:hypothetical protein [Priestia megaterium]|uniref:hypothetical protein n=1 Tax=Priestia megaterium TaxID=1404 RepID=UPI0031FC3F4C
MIDYLDPIPPVRKFIDDLLPERVFGNTFPSTVALPAVLVRNMGGTDYTRLQLLVRANDDITAMQTLIRAMNSLERYGSNIKGLRVLWIERETAPISATDEDTNKPEAWCYMRVETLQD